MTHSAIHFSLGALAATGLCLPSLARRFRSTGTPLARPLLKWLVCSLGAGLWAVVPAILLHAGVPAAFCHGWWMNVFMLHPLLFRLNLGGTIVATAMLAFCFAVHYGLLLCAVRIAEKRQAAALCSGGPVCPRGC